MPSSTNIRFDIIHCQCNGENQKESYLQGFVAKLLRKTDREGCNLVTVSHKGDQYGGYDVSLVSGDDSNFLRLLLDQITD